MKQPPAAADEQHRAHRNERRQQNPQSDHGMPLPFRFTLGRDWMHVMHIADWWHNILPFPARATRQGLYPIEERNGVPAFRRFGEYGVRALASSPTPRSEAYLSVLRRTNRCLSVRLNTLRRSTFRAGLLRRSGRSMTTGRLLVVPSATHSGRSEAPTKVPSRPITTQSCALT